MCVWLQWRVTLLISNLGGLKPGLQVRVYTKGRTDVCAREKRVCIKGKDVRGTNWKGRKTTNPNLIKADLRPKRT